MRTYCKPVGVIVTIIFLVFFYTLGFAAEGTWYGLGATFDKDGAPYQLDGEYYLPRINERLPMEKISTCVLEIPPIIVNLEPFNSRHRMEDCLNYGGTVVGTPLIEDFPEIMFRDALERYIPYLKDLLGGYKKMKKNNLSREDLAKTEKNIMRVQSKIDYIGDGSKMILLRAKRANPESRIMSAAWYFYFTNQDELAE